ncbi:MAG TPA: T9SS type A sorting domain-containing protein, partial [Bacteroidia bacterium]|nr:T9SS type A sorting domain-containing protein [Bacteroidia bacterium]
CNNGSATAPVVYVGGYFLQVNSGTAADCIASWTPDLTTYPYTNGTWSTLGVTAMGNGNSVSNNNPHEVYAMAYYNGILYVGGNFSSITSGAGTITCNNLAKYNVSTNTWSAVGSGISNDGSRIGYADNYAADTYGGGYPVQALAVDGNGNLYIGGNFNTANGVSGYNNIAVYNISGNTWSKLGSGVSGSNANYNVSFNIPGICDFGNSGDDGGGYNSPSYLGPTSPTVYAIDVVDNTHVYVGGQFTSPGNNIAMWNGSNWTSSSVGSTGIPQCSYYNGACGGTFATPGTDGGFGWSLCPVVLSLANVGTSVYVGGVFENTATNTNIAVWNQGSSSWGTLTNGGVCGQTNQEAEVCALNANNGILYVGGDFESYGSGGNGYNIAAYDGWMDLPSSGGGFQGGLSNVLAITSISGVNGVGNFGILFAGGDFPASNPGTKMAQIGQYAGISAGPVSVLPIKLLSFDAIYNQSNGVVDLTWETATEVNNKEFTIEKSKDGIDWVYVTSQPGAGNSTTNRYYSAVDEQPYLGVSYYRLKQTDFDGHYTYSNIAPVSIDEILTRMLVIPNPANNSVAVSFNCNTPGTGEMNVYDCTGRMVYSKELTTLKGINSILFNVSEYSNGVYFITVNTAQNQYTAKLVVSH